MQFQSSSKNGRKAKLTKSEMLKLKDAQLIVKELSQFFPEYKTLEDILKALQPDGTVAGVVQAEQK